jgi:LacI family transcriptional regulator
MMISETPSLKRPNTPGFRDVAIRAGVSVTTVERVLNERGSVSPGTRMKVLEAAAELRLRRVLPSPDYGNLRIEAILPSNPTQYWAKLSAGLKNAAKQLPRGITLYRTFVPEFDPQAMIRAITMSQMKRSALIVAAEIDGEIERALTDAMLGGEIVVCVSTMIKGLPTHAFSGVDNVAAGRTAASLINFALRGKGPGRVLVLQANSTMQSHRDRVQGFIEVLSQGNTVEIIVTNEVPSLSRSYLSEMLARNQIPLAVYETADSADEIAPLMRTLETRPIWIGHERNSVHNDLMREGLLDFVLDQDPERQARWAMKHILSQLGIAGSVFSTVRRPELRLFCASNLQEDDVLA